MSDIQDLGSGSTFIEISKSALEEFEIYYPESIDDQISIAHSLKNQFFQIKETKNAIMELKKDLDILPGKLLFDAFKIN
jgi:type I restriction enzyme S subunit